MSAAIPSSGCGCTGAGKPVPKARRACTRSPQLRSEPVPYKTVFMKVKELADSLSARLIGEGSTEVTGMASISSAKAGELVFVEDEKHLPAALSSAAGAIVAGEFASKEKSNKPLLIASNPRLAFARAATIIHKPSGSSPGVHSTAAVAAERPGS